MKVCPVCKAVAFDDATVCYGCLHDFESVNGVSRGLPDLESNFFANGDSAASLFGDEDAGQRDGFVEIAFGKPSGDQGEELREDNHHVLRQGPPHAPAHSGTLAEFVIRFTPVEDPAGDIAWKCVVES